MACIWVLAPLSVLQFDRKPGTLGEDTAEVPPAVELRT